MLLSFTSWSWSLHSILQLKVLPVFQRRKSLLTAFHDLRERIFISLISDDFQGAQNVLVSLNELYSILFVFLTLRDALPVSIDLFPQSTPLGILVAIDLSHARSQALQLLGAMVHIDAVVRRLTASLFEDLVCRLCYLDLMINLYEHRFDQGVLLNVKNWVLSGFLRHFWLSCHFDWLSFGHLNVLYGGIFL